MKNKRSKRTIGDTMDPEIVLPKWEKHHIYADTETFKQLPPDVEPWNFTGTPQYTQVMEACDNIPWLLVWSFKTIKLNSQNQPFVSGGWYTDVSLVWEDLHESLFLDLQAIYKLKRLPVLFFHNASFDLTAMISLWKMLDPDITVYFYAKSNNKSFLRGAMYSPKYNFKCELGDTMLYEMISVQTIGISLGKFKGSDVPYNLTNVYIDDGHIFYIDLDDGQEKTYPLADYVEYAIRDVEIIREYGETLREKKQLIAKAVIEDPVSYDHVKDKLRGLTQGSFSKELVDIYLMQNGYSKGVDGHFRFDIPETQNQVYQETVKSNMGGYTTFNKDIRYYECDNSESIYVYDCNSEYPFILTQEIPFEHILDQPPERGPYKTWYIVTFKSCKWKKEMDSLKWPPISFEKVGPDSNIRFYMLKEYYELINRLCEHESTIHEIKYQKSTKIFKSFIERLYELRKKYKQSMSLINKGSPEYEVLDKQQHGCKIIMNSIYGKLCEKSHKEGCFYYSKTNKYKKFDNYVAPLKCILSGSFITYAGRLLLISKLEASIKAGFKVLYADTDSVMFVANKDDPKIKEIFGEDTGELGQWKLEGEFNLFLNSGVKKKYCLLDTKNPANHKIAWSGINKAVPKAFKSKLNEGDKQVIEDLKYIFNPENNVLFKKQKRTTVLSSRFNQKIIYDTDFQMNKSIKKITAECYVDGKGYILNKYGC